MTTKHENYTSQFRLAGHKATTPSDRKERARLVELARDHRPAGRDSTNPPASLSAESHVKRMASCPQVVNPQVCLSVWRQP